MEVELKKVWMNHKKGEVLDLKDDFARTLVARKTAVCVDPLYGGSQKKRQVTKRKSKVRNAPNKMMTESPVET